MRNGSAKQIKTYGMVTPSGTRYCIQILYTDLVYRSCINGMVTTDRSYIYGMVTADRSSTYGMVTIDISYIYGMVMPDRFLNT